MDPRYALLTVLSTAFREAIADIGGRVGVMRVEPIWGEEELPIILIDFESEQREIRTQSPREYKHTLAINIVVYCDGGPDRDRVKLLRVIGDIENLMREWQFIQVKDADPQAPDGDAYLIDDIRGGHSVDYFLNTEGNRDCPAARLVYEAEFYTGGSTDGIPRDGAPRRNRLAEFESMLARWQPRNRSEGAPVLDHCEINGESNA